jgi:hypothetical protein
LSDLPGSIRAEVKFTTGTDIAIPVRELDALPAGKGCAAVVAVLLWCGDREIDGDWLVVDSKASFGRGSGGSRSAGKEELKLAELSQPDLDGIRDHVSKNWKRFLGAHVDLALQGHDPTRSELERLHRDGALMGRLPAHKVLQSEHREHVRRIVESLGESVAGLVFQDLFAYLLGMAGYREVKINAVGVPDVELSGLVGFSAEHAYPFEPEEIEELIEACRRAGNNALADKVLQTLGSRELLRTSTR